MRVSRAVSWRYARPGSCDPRTRGTQCIGHRLSARSLRSRYSGPAARGVGGVSLEEGASVTVLAKDDEVGFALTPEQEVDLLLSIAEADRGETVSAEEVLARLARRHAK